MLSLFLFIDKTRPGVKKKISCTGSEWVDFKIDSRGGGAILEGRKGGRVGREEEW